jgi:hypothetical protein
MAPPVVLLRRNSWSEHPPGSHPANIQSAAPEPGITVSLNPCEGGMNGRGVLDPTAIVPVKLRSVQQSTLLWRRAFPWSISTITITNSSKVPGFRPFASAKWFHHAWHR